MTRYPIESKEGDMQTTIIDGNDRHCTIGATLCGFVPARSLVTLDLSADVFEHHVLCQSQRTSSQ